MSKKSTYLLGILLTIVIGSLLYWYLCCSVCCKKETFDVNKTTQKVSQDNIVKPKEKQPTFIPFSIKDATGDLKFSIDESFNFNESSFNIRDSIPETLDNGVLKIKEYLDANGDKRFNITGYFISNETNKSAFPNLGLARANSVKNYMISKGISSKLINTFGELNEDIVFDNNNVLFGPLAFNIFTRTEESVVKDVALKTACEAIKESPLKLCFRTGQAHIKLTADQRQKFSNISHCVDKFGLTIQVVGHTDNTGNAEANMQLGKKRANSVKDYLVQNGILQENIAAYSKGQNEPIVGNETEDGRAKNRRIVVTIN
jgi:outer membrane protein OmpA-like peptidoglycan-associated protein